MQAPERPEPFPQMGECTRRRWDLKKSVMFPEPGLAYNKQELSWNPASCSGMVATGRRGVRINIGDAWETSRNGDAVAEALVRLKRSARLYQKLARFHNPM